MKRTIDATQEKAFKADLISKLIQRAEYNPRDVKTLLRLAELYRETGQLTDCAHTYERLQDLSTPKTRYKRMLAILNQRPLGLKQITSEVREAPFLIIDNFLNTKEFQIIQNTLINKYHLFRDSEVVMEDETVVNEDLRSSQSISPTHFPETEKLILRKIENLHPHLFNHLEIKKFNYSKIEMQLSRYRDGDYFKLHQDQKIGNPTENRMITFVYYFYKEPKTFEGGDLHLHDTSSDGQNYRMSYTLYEPKHNSIILFPSNTYHKVGGVKSIQSGPFDGRFTINGWIHK